MPTAPEILGGVTALANDHVALAGLWHAVLAGAIVALASGAWRPSARAMAGVGTAPLASAAALAWVGRNPFNGVVLTAAALGLLLAASRVAVAPLRRGSTWAWIAGVAAIAFAWLYPHFLDAHPAWIYAVAAPVGIVPCPSLALVLGIGLCADGFGSRAWTTIAALTGLFYGLFGVLRLGVWLDLPLVLVALASLASTRRLASTRGMAAHRS